MELVEVERWRDLRPFDMLGEGRVIYAIVYLWDPHLEVGDCDIVLDPETGLRCPEFHDVHDEPVPEGKVRVMRGWHEVAYLGNPLTRLRESLT